MKSLVVDASVAIKWFIPEVHAPAAARLWQKNFTFIAPTLIFAEVASILWKKQRLKEISPDIATAILNDCKRLPVDKYDLEPLIDAAWYIAGQHGCTVYDSLYVSLAYAEKCQLVTADQKLVTSLSKTPLAKSLLWVEDI